jgi:hypothetical protein
MPNPRASPKGQNSSQQFLISLVLHLPADNGDQMGRIFADWAIVYIGQFLKITEVGQIFYGYLFISPVNFLY